VSAADDDAKGVRSTMSDYRELAPPHALARYVLCTWTRSTGEVGSDLQVRVVPDGCADIVWIGDAAPHIAGPATLPVVAGLPPRSTIVGVRFRPGMAPSLLGVPAAELLNAEVRLRDVWGRVSPDLDGHLGEPGSGAVKLAVLERALVSRLDDAGPADSLVGAAVARLARQPGGQVRELSRSLDVSERQLLRRFQAAVGYGPKTFQRILRFQRLLRLVRRTPADERSLASLATVVGYADQAHMTREVTRLAGLPPGELLADRDSSPAMSDSFKTQHHGVGEAAG
jgi:AraC-like DNA-binding protein